MYRAFIRNQQGVEMGGGTSKKQPVPRGGSEKELRVENLNLHVRPPTRDTYKCTPKQEGDGNLKLVIRRGEQCHLSIGLDSPWENDKHSLALKLSYGPSLHVSKETLVEVKVDNTRNRTFAATQWGAYIHSTDGKMITLKVHVPSNCIVGAWKLEVTSFCKVRNTQQLLSTTYRHNQDLIILFNPWCEEDLCYMEDRKDLDEYVLNEKGIMYQGDYKNKWTYGQFEEGILDAALDILTHELEPAEYQQLADPVKAVRHVAMVIKSGLVLRGRWPSIRKTQDNYKGGTKPTLWHSSVKILRDYMNNHEPVKYGQCWVFAGVITTVFRALGIPCRPVTNYQSGAETDGSNTVDRVYTVDGLNVTDEHTTDFVWNYHVWNEVWLRRPDLDKRHSSMDGWQALDTTGFPPKQNDEEDVFRGDYLCDIALKHGHYTFCDDHLSGPAPVLALKHGYCTLNYDAGFLFSGANADLVYWEVGADGKTFSVLRIDKHRIGRNLSTKQPGSDEKLDLTDRYKFKEGGPENEDAVLKAHRAARNPRLRWNPAHYKSNDEKVVRLKIVTEKTMIGKDVSFTLKASNVSQQTRLIRSMYVTVYPKTYHGALGEHFFREKFTNTELSVGNETGFKKKFTLTEADYAPHLLEKAILFIEVYAVVSSQTGDQEDQQGEEPHYVIKSRTFEFDVLPLGVKPEGQTKANVGKGVEYELSFTNPLTIPLTQCVISAESPGIEDVKDYEMTDIQPGKKIKHTMKCVAKQSGEHAVKFKLDTMQLDAIGKATIDANA